MPKWPFGLYYFNSLLNRCFPTQMLMSMCETWTDQPWPGWKLRAAEHLLCEHHKAEKTGSPPRAGGTIAFSNPVDTCVHAAWLPCACEWLRSCCSLSKGVGGRLRTNILVWRFVSPQNLVLDHPFVLNENVIFFYFCSFTVIFCPVIP